MHPRTLIRKPFVPVPLATVSVDEKLFLIVVEPQVMVGLPLPPDGISTSHPDAPTAMEPFVPAAPAKAKGIVPVAPEAKFTEPEAVILVENEDPVVGRNCSVKVQVPKCGTVAPEQPSNVDPVFRMLKSAVSVNARSAG